MNLGARPRVPGATPRHWQSVIWTTQIRRVGKRFRTATRRTDGASRGSATAPLSSRWRRHRVGTASAWNAPRIFRPHCNGLQRPCARASRRSSMRSAASERKASLLGRSEPLQANAGTAGICVFETFGDVSNRPKATVADRVRGRRSWADSAPTRVASERAGVCTKAGIQVRPRKLALASRSGTPFKKLEGSSQRKMQTGCAREPSPDGIIVEPLGSPCASATSGISEIGEKRHHRRIPRDYLRETS